MINANIINQAKEINIEKVLNYYGIYGNKDGQFHCPNPNHSDTHRSASINQKDNKIYCFSCYSGRAVGYDTIDIVRFNEGLNFRQAVEKVLKIDGYNVERIIEEDNERKDKTGTFKDGKEQYKWFINRVKDYNNLLKLEGNELNYKELKQLQDDINENLNNRYLNYKKIEEALKFNKITLNGNYYKDKNTGELITSIVYNISQGEKFCIQKGFIKNSEGKKVKRNYGNPHYIEILNNKNNILYITEGIEDALTFTQAGRNAISLNSTSNLNRFIEDIHKYNNYHFIIALDKDKTGQEATLQLKEVLNKHNISYEDYKPLLDCKNEDIKDVNEYWIYINKLKRSK